MSRKNKFKLPPPPPLSAIKPDSFVSSMDHLRSKLTHLEETIDILSNVLLQKNQKTFEIFYLMRSLIKDNSDLTNKQAHVEGLTNFIYECLRQINEKLFDIRECLNNTKK